jgi:hypothetical protein
MRYRIGRLLQVAGLLITPAGIMGNLVHADEITVKTSLTIAAAGVTVFVIGWLLQQSAKRT